MVEISNPSLRIDLNEFKLHLFFKNKTPLTLHFDTLSRKFYLSLIALVIIEMKKAGKIKTICYFPRNNSGKIRNIYKLKQPVV
jgi:hypothetical protein